MLMLEKNMHDCYIKKKKKLANNVDPDQNERNAI